MSQDALAGYYKKKTEKCFKSEMLQKSRGRYQNLPREEKKIKNMVAKNIKIFQKMKKC